MQDKNTMALRSFGGRDFTGNFLGSDVERPKPYDDGQKPAANQESAEREEEDKRQGTRRVADFSNTTGKRSEHTTANFVSLLCGCCGKVKTMSFFKSLLLVFFN
jgi:hypothetical protein